MPDRNPVIMENVQILFPNFQGKEDEFTRAGERNFNILLSEVDAQNMLRDGWNVKRLRPREGEEVGNPYLNIAVSYKVRPPQIFMITSRGRTPLDEETVSSLDFVEFKTADLIINPYHWNVRDESGIKAYLQSLYVTIVEDPLALKYAALDEAGRKSDLPWNE